MHEWIEEQLSKLVDGRILKVLRDDSGDDGDMYYGLLIQTRDVQMTIWFLRDEEGNGPGYPQIEEVIDG